MKNRFLYVSLLLLMAACSQNGRRSVVEQEPTTEIVFLTEKNHDFGVCYKPEPLSFDFVFRNDGRVPYVINRVESSCGCLEVVYPKYPVQPGAVDSIHVIYDGNGFTNGYFTKRCDIYSNATDSVYSLRIGGYYNKTMEEDYLKGKEKK